MLGRIRQDFVSVVNLSSSMKIVDPINAIRSQYKCGTGYSSSFGWSCVSRIESREILLGIEDCGSRVASSYRYGERVATSNSKTRILSTPVCVTYIDRRILIRFPLGRTENILERFHDEV